MPFALCPIWVTGPHFIRSYAVDIDATGSASSRHRSRRTRLVRLSSEFLCRLLSSLTPQSTPSLLVRLRPYGFPYPSLLCLPIPTAASPAAPIDAWTPGRWPWHYGCGLVWGKLCLGLRQLPASPSLCPCNRRAQDYLLTYSSHSPNSAVFKSERPYCFSRQLTNDIMGGEASEAAL